MKKKISKSEGNSNIQRRRFFPMSRGDAAADVHYGLIADGLEALECVRWKSGILAF